jgi:hypothetical protein
VMKAGKHVEDLPLRWLRVTNPISRYKGELQTTRKTNCPLITRLFVSIVVSLQLHKKHFPCRMSG